MKMRVSSSGRSKIGAKRPKDNFSNMFHDFFHIFGRASGQILQKVEPLLWKKLNFQALIKSAASAASVDLQERPWTTARHADGEARGLPCKSRASSRLDRGLKV